MVLISLQEGACSCTDCEDACLNPNFPTGGDGFVIFGGFDGLTFIMIILYSVLFFVVVALVATPRILNRQVKTDRGKESSKFAKNEISQENQLQTWKSNR